MSEPGTAVEAMVALWTPIFATYAPDLVLGRVFMASVMFAGEFFRVMVEEHVVGWPPPSR
jgi:hypothetical protein